MADFAVIELNLSVSCLIKVLELVMIHLFSFYLFLVGELRVVIPPRLINFGFCPMIEKKLCN